MLRGQKKNAVACYHFSYYAYDKDDEETEQVSLQNIIVEHSEQYIGTGAVRWPLFCEVCDIFAPNHGICEVPRETFPDKLTFETINVYLAFNDLKVSIKII